MECRTPTQNSLRTFNDLESWDNAYGLMNAAHPEEAPQEAQPVGMRAVAVRVDPTHGERSMEACPPGELTVWGTIDENVRIAERGPIDLGY